MGAHATWIYNVCVWPHIYGAHIWGAPLWGPGWNADNNNNNNNFGSGPDPEPTRPEKINVR